MISTYRLLGQNRMLNEGFYDMEEAEPKLYIIRQFCAEGNSFKYKKNGSDQVGRLIRMNLDTQNGTISFIQDNEISSTTCAQKLIFKNYAPKDPNIYGSHTSYKSIFSFALKNFIEKNRKAIAWSCPKQIDNCLDYLWNISERFFIEDDISIRPQYKLLPDELQKDFPDPDLVPAIAQASKGKDQNKAFGNALKKYFDKSLAHLVGEKQAYALSIDGKLIHEIEELRTCYIDVLYYYMLDKKFTDSNSKGHCHLCSSYENLASDVAIKQKFYGTTYKPFFDNTKDTRSYTAFSLCKDCYHQVTVGTSFASSALNTYLINLSCLILPELKYDGSNRDVLEEIDPEQIKTIVRLLKRQSVEDRKSNLLSLRKLQDSFDNFSLFFYYVPSPTSQEFIINRFIKNISLPSIIDKSEDLCSLSLQNKLSSLFNDNYSLSFDDLRLMVFPSRQSKPIMKLTDFQKINRSILALLSAYLYSRPINMNTLIKNYVNVMNDKFHNSSNSSYRWDLSPYLMNLYLKHLSNFNLLKGVRKMEEKTMTTTLQKQELVEYFENHPHVYGNNHFAQGLFIMGWFLNELEYKQKLKGINRTAVHKLNLRGIPAQKVKSISTAIDDLRLVWKVWTDPMLDAYYRECLSESDTSMFPEEVVYHILSGRSYCKYVGVLKGEEKKENQETKDTEMEEQND
ncbi:MAG: hypothetical protein M0Q19_06265 [Candidatus Cloacimonetes bacterium]|jgi:CRISPR-associated protein Csh1|nr:hypothetical protein [Candidatus Cloacimonadota bacterium]MCK9332767.1 hypothetical protein [Candidatus Cloacimonadota bacterium]